MDALERSQAQQHTGLLARLRKLPQANVIDFIEANDLPAAVSQWDLTTLRRCVESIEAEVAAAPGSAFVLRFKKGADGELVFLKVERVASFARAQNKAHDYRLLTASKGQTVVAVGSTKDLQDVSMDILIALIASVEPGVTPQSVPNKEMAMAKAKEALGKVADTQNPPAEAPAAKKTATKKVATPKEPRAAKPVNYEPKPKDQIKQVKAGTKIATLIDLLVKGTTIEEIEKTLSATGKPVNARAWLGYDLRTVAGYGVTQDDKGALRIKLPAGMKAPIAHKTVEEKANGAKETKETKKGKKAEAVAEAPVEVVSIAEAPFAKAAKKSGSKK